jgi:hypothetical protein
VRFKGLRAVFLFHIFKGHEGRNPEQDAALQSDQMNAEAQGLAPAVLLCVCVGNICIREVLSSNLD